MNKKIFVIEDDPDVALLIKDVFMMKNIEARFFSSSSIAVLEIPKESPDIIIMDLMMPNISGFDICKYVRSNPRLKNTIVMVITGYDSPKMRKEIFSLGIDDYLPKPFDVKTFLEKISRFI
ncbi:MAG: hypothetical protein A2252_10985 [Elusimicrobia bacterium RIFOXYA2_FULL_39_19]|nr:MAG: hypothetical protein A2252_10985 [Elusimicrobia bacterium RIFOXYA2_FULL_39_19]